MRQKLSCTLELVIAVPLLLPSLALVGQQPAVPVACNANGALVAGSSCYPSIQSAHDALPSNGGSILVPSGISFSGLVITKPVRLTFGHGTFKFTGQGTAITCRAVNAPIIEGSGFMGGGSSNGTIIAVSDRNANGIDVNNCPGIVIRDLSIVGPGSGNGKGLIVTSNSGLVQNVVVKAFGSDGCTINGTRGNGNAGRMSGVRCANNGGIGLNVFGNDGNLWAFTNVEVSTNGGLGAQFASGPHVFDPLHSFGNNHGGVGVAFTGGGSQNWGVIYSDNGTQKVDISFAAGANNNYLFLPSGLSVTNNGVNNTWYGSGGFQSRLNAKGFSNFGPVVIGSHGTPFNAIVTSDALLRFTAIAPRSCQEQSIHAAGASTANFGVFASPRSDLGQPNLSWSAWVNTPNNVAVRICNPTDRGVTPSEAVWGVTTLQ